VVQEPAPVAKESRPPATERSFSVDSLYELLAAEFAGIREEVRPALDIYIQQAHDTRDPGVIERAVHIASFLRDSDAILELARLWVEVEPDNIEVRRLLAFHLARTGKVIEAFPHGEYLLLSGDDDYLQSLAAFAQDSPREEKLRLLALYDDLQSQHPHNPGLLLGKAMLLRQLERLEDSMETTDRLLKLDKRNETGQLLRAQLFHAMNERKKALTSLEKALKLIPESKRLRLQYARFLSDENLAKSRDQIQILSDYYPDDANIRFSLGLANKELGRVEEARSTFEYLVETKQRASDAQFQLGKIAEDANQPEEAVYRYRQVKEGQNLLPAAMRAAEILMEHDNLSAAREHLSALRAIYPAVRQNLFQMEAELLLRQQRYTESYDLLTSALQEEPESLNLLYARSIISTEQGDLPAAEADLRAVMAQDENNATALNALGYTLLNMSDRYDEAMALIMQAHEIEPDNPAILDSLGWAYFRLEQHDKALDYLRKAFEAFPDAEVAAHLGEVLWVSGEQEEAREIWQQGLTSSPDDKTLLETLNRLMPDRGTAGTPDGL
jgi:tetratricopeptide (TPR) repeat protein